MTIDIPRSTVKAGSDSGFVLISTLLLMALAVLIIVAMFVSAQLDLRTVDSAVKVAQSRANARLGLEMAIADLQRSAGPDQAATAPASTLDTDPDTLVIDGVDPQRTRWVGVYPTVNRDDPSFPVYENPEDLEDLRAAVEPNPVWLVSNETPPNIAQPLVNPVKVGSKIEIDSTTGVTTEVVQEAGRREFSVGNLVGGYAWFAEDEGLKAHFTLTNPTLAADLADPSAEEVNLTSLRQFFGPRRLGIETIDGPIGTAFDPLDPNLEKLQTIRQLPLLYNSGALDPRAFSDDFTMSSLGIPANSKDGGLRKDLTAGFEDPLQFRDQLSFLAPDNPDPGKQDGMLVFAHELGNGEKLFGPSWDPLYAYYNKYRPYQQFRFEPSDGGHAATGSLVADIDGTWRRGILDPTETVAAVQPDFRRTQPDMDEFYHSSPTNDPSDPNGGDRDRGAPAQGCLKPQLLGWHIHLGLDSYTEVDLAGATVHKLRLHMYPALVLWNPYNVELTASDIVQESNAFGMLHLQVLVDNQVVFKDNAMNYRSAEPYDDVNGNGRWDDGEPFTDTNTDGKYTQTGVARWRFKPKDDVALRPGEIKLFGYVEDPDDANNELDIESRHMELVNDYVDLHGGWTKLEDIVSSDGQTQAWAGTVDGSHQVKIVMPENRIRANAGWFYHNGPQNSTTDRLSAISSNRIMNCYRSEEYTDVNGNGRYDDGEPFVDLNGNGEWDPQENSFSPTPIAIDLGPISNLNSDIPGGAEQKFAGMTMWTRPVRSASHAPIAPFSSWNPLRFRDASAHVQDARYDLISGLLSHNEIQNRLITNAGQDTILGFWGEDTIATGRSYVVLKDIPRQPMTSIGEFMHLDLPTREFHSLYPLGGSRATPFVPSNEIESEWRATVAGVTARVADQALLYNEALFDGYFFSTTPSGWREDPGKDGSGSISLVKRDEKVKHDGTEAFPQTNYTPKDYFFPRGATFDQAYVDQGKPLANSRMRYYAGLDGSAPIVSDLQDFDKSAANLFIEGAFNVNSTSVDAWVAFLSGNDSSDVRYWDGENTQEGATIDGSDLRNPIPRFAIPAGEANDAWSGIRDLSDTEVRDLAEKMVAEVKRRGPFLSLSDFVNRRVVSGELGMMGAIQAAIDATSINDNTALIGIPVREDTPVPVDMNRDGNPDVYIDNLPEHSAVGIPGHLEQNDILRNFAPTMASRSDTFTIRSYGEVRGTSGSNEAMSRAWCEATVQRLPEYVEHSDDPTVVSGDLPWTHPDDATSVVNQKFGRKFVITSFRWLSPDDL